MCIFLTKKQNAMITLTNFLKNPQDIPYFPFGMNNNIEKYTEALLNPTPQDKLTTELIVSVVCGYFKIPAEMMNVVCRKKEIVVCRQWIFYLLRKLTSKSLSVIGKEVGQKDHATVLYATEQIGKMINIYPEWDKILQNLMREIHEKTGLDIEPVPVQSEKPRRVSFRPTYKNEEQRIVNASLYIERRLVSDSRFLKYATI